MKEIVIAGAMALTLLGQQTGTGVAVAQQTTPQQQTIPDAPRPQGLPLTNVAPGKAPNTSNSNATDPDQPAVGSTLPNSPSQPTADDQGPPPVQPAPGQGPATFTLQLQTNFVEVPFTVKDNKGHLVPALSARDVRVYENGLRQHTAVFTSDPFPMSVAMVIDQSMPFDTMTRVNNSLEALPAAFASYDEVAVFTYNNGPRMQTDFTSGTSARLSAVLERSKSSGREAMYYAPGEGLGHGIDINNGAQKEITPLGTGGGVGTPQGVTQVPREVHTLNDAILEAAKSLSKAKQGRRRIIYVISDGKEYGSVAKTKDVIKFLQTNNIQVFATLTGDASVEGLGFIERIHVPLMMRDNNLKAYTDATGGALFAEYRQKAIETSFSQVTEQVRTQYTIGYYSREPFIDGKYRKLEVQILKPNLNVIAKDGYFPSASQASRQRPTAPVSTTPNQ
ncbi:VWA domain-containing protein [Granulicella tundricola]|uniref:VWFA-related domain protein n=1 Tax=Granulicella tundricola (strain ATCC BAA-1859 / DSM 23138 / MP5ACTX9) TaxID=1198114 RepID=E8X0B1_GRATM|nr:VWA domain-containing protein [Granulicella tundricola]ADW70092.1 VWFA-related domain protein [Granulicella tundricola MP5ACTX9]